MQAGKGSITGSVRSQKVATDAELLEWFKYMSDASGEERPRLSAQQAEVIAKVQRRIMAGRRQEEDRCLQSAMTHDVTDKNLTQPLFWIKCGKPGAGKSHITDILRQACAEEFRWCEGIEFAIVVLPGLVADLLDGETVHCALGGDPLSGQNEVWAERSLQ